MEGYQCYCEGNSSAYRSFLTKAEKIQMLKDYKDSLDNESEGVQEKISQLESEK